MTDTIRDLLISLASHMAYMQGQLEVRHELDDPEDYYWYRESVLLRQKVTDALTDEPASATGQPSDEELLRAAAFAIEPHHIRWNTPAPQPPAEGEVAELVQHLRHAADADAWDGASPEWCQSMLRAAELLQRLSPPQPVPVSERLPGPEDCDAEGRCWWWYPEVPGKTYGYWAHEDDAVPERAFNEQPLHWLPAHALPLPEVGQ